MNAVTQYACLIGRILIGQLFLLAGISKIGQFGQLAAGIAAKGWPASQVALIITIIIEIGGAVMLILGWRAKLAAAAIFLWIIPVTFTFHNFWNMTGPVAYVNQIMFQKDLALMGGLLFIFVFGPGRYSLRND